MKNKTAFFDRDGVLNHSIVRDGKPYPPSSLNELVIYDDAAACIEKLKAHGFFIIVVTNQPDVGRGTQNIEIVNAINDALMQSLQIDHIEMCIDEKSDCYKPLPGMLLNCSKKFNIDLKNSYMIGDRWRDVGAGKNANCKKTILLESGYHEDLIYTPDYICDTLTQATHYIMRDLKGEI